MWLLGKILQNSRKKLFTMPLFMQKLHRTNRRRLYLVQRIVKQTSKDLRILALIVCLQELDDIL
jgi:hypothetical protein